MTLVIGSLSGEPRANAEDFIVYSVFKPVDLGIANEAPAKDYYVNMGSAQGLRPGSTLDVLRKVASYDLSTQKLYKDVVFPFAKLKVIHVENDAAIARLDKFLPAESTPVLAPKAVMVGDIVKLPR